jgi:hypothetical protein
MVSTKLKLVSTLSAVFLAALSSNVWSAEIKVNSNLTSQILPDNLDFRGSFSLIGQLDPSTVITSATVITRFSDDIDRLTYVPNYRVETTSEVLLPPYGKEIHRNILNAWTDPSDAAIMRVGDQFASTQSNSYYENAPLSVETVITEDWRDGWYPVLISPYCVPSANFDCMVGEWGSRLFGRVVDTVTTQVLGYNGSFEASIELSSDNLASLSSLSTLDFTVRGIHGFTKFTSATLVINTAMTNPVPEPETYAMMLAGLGLLGVAARRRKQKSAA